MAQVYSVARLAAWRAVLRHVLAEARKRNPSGRPTPPLGDVNNSYFTPDDKKASAQLQKKYARLRGQFAKAMSAQVGGVESGVLNAADFADTSRRVIRKYYKAAYEIGKQITGDDPALTKDDFDAIDGEADDEIPYAEKFADDVESGSGRMDYEQRAGMYTQALDSLFTMGQVSGLPPGTIIHWRLGAAEHCEDCVEWAGGSPYTPDTLPAVPRDGTSRCKSRCKCSLDIDLPEEIEAPADAPTDTDADPDAAAEFEPPPPPTYPSPAEAPAASVPNLDKFGDPVTDDVAAAINDLRAKINYYRQRAELAKDEDERDEFLNLRRQANSDLIDYEEKAGVYSVPTWSVKELVQAAKEAPEDSLVTDPGQVTAGKQLALMKGRSVWRAKVTTVRGNRVKAKTFDGTDVEFDIDEPPYLVFDAPDIDFDGDGEVEDFETLDAPAQAAETPAPAIAKSAADLARERLADLPDVPGSQGYQKDIRGLFPKADFNLPRGRNPRVYEAEVPLDELYSDIQGYVHLNRIAGFLKPGAPEPDQFQDQQKIALVKVGGKYHIVSGNHRLTAMKLLGRRTATATVEDYD